MELPENSYGYLLKHGAPFAEAYTPGGLGVHPVKLNMTWHFPDRAFKAKSQKRYEDTYVFSSPKACAICMYLTAHVLEETLAQTAFAVVSRADPGMSEFYSPVASIWQTRVCDIPGGTPAGLGNL